MTPVKARVTRGVPEYGIEIGPIRYVFQHRSFDAVISVDDSFRELLMTIPRAYWIPIHETGRSWGYMPFFQAKKILDYLCLESPVQRLYLACHGGVHRSPMIAFTWLPSLGWTSEQAARAFTGTFNDPVAMHTRDVSQGYIPPRLGDMWNAMREFPDWSFMDILKVMQTQETVSHHPLGGIIEE